MSFYMVPTVLYQTQQKLRKANKKKKRTKHHTLANQSGHLDDTHSIKSTSTGSAPSIHSHQPDLAETSTPTSIDIHHDEDLKEIHNDTNQSSNLNLPAISHSNSTTSLSSNVATKYFSPSEHSNPSSPNPNHTHTFSPSMSQPIPKRNNDSDSLAPLDVHVQHAIAAGSGSAIPTISERQSSIQSSTSSSSHKFRRNSSLASSSSVKSPGLTSRFGRRLSSPFLHDKKNKNSPLQSPSEVPSSQSNSNSSSTIFKTSFQENDDQEDSSSVKITPRSPEPIPALETQDSYFPFKIPKFEPLVDLSDLNSPKTLNKTLLSPAFQIFRYNNYLDLLTDHQKNDPVNFAGIRYHSLLKFISRHKRVLEQKRTSREGFDHGGDIRNCEALLAYELLDSRSFLRELITMSSRNRRSTIISCEELVQVNFTNYMRFILNLPDLKQLNINMDSLDEIERTHYKNKKIFTEIQKELCFLKREETGDEVSVASAINILLHSITKVSYEYILLEKYHIHILTKLNNSYLLESRVTKKLFNLFHFNSALKSHDSIKVLHYNIYFSAQYAWYMAITLPFIRLFESNIYSEDENLVRDEQAYNEYRKNLPRESIVSFKELDEELHQNYFSHLDFKNDFNHYKSLTPQNLVKLHKSIDDKSPKYANAQMESPLLSLSHKPMNFEYFTHPLARIESETFHVIQSRDLYIQLTPDNHKIIFSEFHRILRTGGILEIPMIKFAANDLEGLKALQASKEFPDQSPLVDIDFLTKFNVIPKYIETILITINEIFGSKNVKMSLALMNSVTEVNSFLLKHLSLTMHEMLGNFDSFCSKFGSDDNSVECDTETGIQYYIYVRAEKK